MQLLALKHQRVGQQGAQAGERRRHLRRAHLQSFQRSEIAAVAALKREGVIADYTLTLNAQRNGLGVKATAGDLTTLISVRGIQTQNYPLYGAFDAVSPRQRSTRC